MPAATFFLIIDEIAGKKDEKMTSALSVFL
jgi:hypothetical protein